MSYCDLKINKYFNRGVQWAMMWWLVIPLDSSQLTIYISNRNLCCSKNKVSLHPSPSNTAILMQYDFFPPIRVHTLTAVCAVLSQNKVPKPILWHKEAKWHWQFQEETEIFTNPLLLKHNWAVTGIERHY